MGQERLSKQTDGFSDRSQISDSQDQLVANQDQLVAWQRAEKQNKWHKAAQIEFEATVTDTLNEQLTGVMAVFQQDVQNRRVISSQLQVTQLDVEGNRHDLEARCRVFEMQMTATEDRTGLGGSEDAGSSAEV